jgi:hypothetical protein
LCRITHRYLVEFGMSEDARCCGSGTCIIDAEGRCWCGQQWDGEKMSAAPRPAGNGFAAAEPVAGGSAATPPDADDSLA